MNKVAGSVFFGPDESLQVSECQVALWPVINEDILFSQHQGGYILLTACKSPECKEILPDKVWENAVQYNLAFYGARDAGERGTIDTVLNLKCFIHTVKLRWPTHKLRALYFSVIFLWPLRKLVWPPGRPYGALKADSHIPCGSAKDLDCVFPIWFTQYGRVCFTYAMLFPYHVTKMPPWKRLLKTTAGSRHCRGRVATLSRQGRGRIAAGSQQDRGTVAVGSRQGNGMVCVNRPLETTGLDRCPEVPVQNACVCCLALSGYMYLVQSLTAPVLCTADSTGTLLCTYATLKLR
jgi:hypothetical protein